MLINELEIGFWDELCEGVETLDGFDWERIGKLNGQRVLILGVNQLEDALLFGCMTWIHSILINHKLLLICLFGFSSKMSEMVK